MRIRDIYQKSLSCLLLLFLWLPAVSLGGEVSQWEIYQWRDSRGVIHFTDNLRSVPASVRDTPNLIVRRDLATTETVSSVAPTQPAVLDHAPSPGSNTTEAVGPRNPVPGKVAPRIIYQPQTFTTIVVVNSFVPVRKGITRNRRSPRPAPPRDFNDRRFIHPSAFKSIPGPHVRPETFRSSPR